MARFISALAPSSLLTMAAVPLLVACGSSAPPASSVEAQPAEAQPTNTAGSSAAQSSSPASPPAALPAALPPRVAIGKARILLGDVPPWQTPRVVEAAYPPTTSSPTSSPTSNPPTTATAVSGGLEWKLERTIRVGVGYLSLAELSPDGTLVFVASDDDGILRRYDTKSGKELSRYQYPGFVQFDPIAFTLLPNFEQPGGAPRLALYGTKHDSGLLDLETSEFRATAEPSTEVRATERQGLFGLTRHEIEPQSGVLQLVWIPGPAGGDRSAHIEFVERPDNWALSRDGKLLAVLYYPSDLIEVLDLESRSVRATLPAPKYARGLALSPDGRLLAVGGEELRLYDFERGELLATDKSFGNNIHELRFTPDGKLLLASAYDGKARSFRVEPGRLGKKQLLVHGTANVYALGLDASGTRLVTSSGDRTIKLWKR